MIVTKSIFYLYLNEINVKMKMRIKNKVWAENVIKKFDSSFKHRWIIYEEFLSSLLSKDKVWGDIGCGENQIVEEYFNSAKLATGIDLIKPTTIIKSPFVCSDLYNLPFRSESFDLVTLRYVVEHLEDIQACFSEINRILKPGGKILILTTNIWSPFIFIPFLLPFRFKRFMLKNVYKVEENKVLPTHHRLNSLKAFKEKKGNLRLIQLEFIQDANYVRKWVFIIFFVWHIITKPKFLNLFRTNIIAVYEK